MNDTTGFIIGLILTLFIYSYLLGDNPLYRIAIHILVGVSAAFAAVVAFQRVLLPVFQEMQQNPGSPEAIYWFVPVLLALLLLLRRAPRVSWLSNITLGVLMTVGAAVAVVGALRGTLWPQISTFQVSNAINGLVIALLTIAVLLAFQFTALRTRSRTVWEASRWQRSVSTVGRVVLTITFGALFAAVLSTSLILLANRLNYFLTELIQLLS